MVLLHLDNRIKMIYKSPFITIVKIQNIRLSRCEKHHCQRIKIIFTIQNLQLYYEIPINISYSFFVIFL